MFIPKVISLFLHITYDIQAQIQRSILHERLCLVRFPLYMHSSDLPSLIPPKSVRHIPLLPTNLTGVIPTLPSHHEILSLPFRLPTTPSYASVLQRIVYGPRITSLFIHPPHHPSHSLHLHHHNPAMIAIALAYPNLPYHAADTPI